MKNNDYDVDDQKLIEQREYLEIEDKGPTAAEKQAAAAAVENIDFEEPKRKKTWAGWWAAALFALAIIGCCIYFATRDGRQLERRVAQTSSSVGKKSANAAAFISGKVSDAASSVSDKVSDAASSAAGKVSDVASSAADKVSDAAGAVKDKVSDVAGKAGKAVKSTAASMATAVATTVDGAAAYARYPVASDDLISQEAADERKVDYLYYFANDQSAIPNNEVLNDIAEAARNTDASITITAYASPTGSAAYNDALCQQRAENLENYLVAHGVDADNISIIPGGQTDKFGDDVFCRRADIVVNYAG